MDNFLSNNSSNKYFLIAFGLISTLAIALLFCGVSLVVGSAIYKWQFPLACVSALIATWYAAKFFFGKNSKPVFVKTSCAILAIIGVSILFSGYFYDVSFDGQWYHQETVYRLKMGYNPDYQTLQVPPNEVLISDVPNWCSGVDNPVNVPVRSGKALLNSKFLNMNCFSKGTEMIATAIYQDTGHIETGKAVNVILLMASLFLCLSLLYKIDSISVTKKWLLAILLTFNPVAVIQMLSFCVDGSASCLLLCLLVISCLIIQQQNRYCLFLLGCLVVVAVNIKFTTLVFTAIYIAGLLIALLVYKKADTFKKVFITGAIAAIAGVFCCGFNPYVTNLVQRNNVFYGLKETQVTILELTPPLLKNLNRFEKLALSLSAHQGWTSANKNTIGEIPKIPFTFTKEDIRSAKDPEQELSGFGPFFSGALLITIVLFTILLIGYRKTPAFKQGGAVLLAIIATIVIMPDSWWARFVPQFWLIPVIILLMAEFVSFRYHRVIKAALYISLGLNIAWASTVIISNMFSTATINYQMKQLQVLNKPVNIEYCNYRTFKSNQVRFLEKGIAITEKNVTGPYIYNVVSSNTRFETPAPLPQLPKPFMVRLSDRMNGK